MSNVTQFNQQPWAQREGSMGDIAEAVFDKLNGDRVHHLGLNRVWANGKKLHLSQMTMPMRCAPDRLVIDRMVEVMGIGRDKTLKIKHDKLDALKTWTAIGPVDLFVYSSAGDEWWQASIERWEAKIGLHAREESFPEGRPYWALHSDHFPEYPTAVETAVAA